MRDIGRSRRTRKRPPVQVTFGLQDVSSLVDRPAGMVGDSKIPNALASWPFPVELDLRSKELVHFSTHAFRIINWCYILIK